MRRTLLLLLGPLLLLAASCATTSNATATIEVQGTVQENQLAVSSPAAAKISIPLAKVSPPGTACYTVSGRVMPPVPGDATLDLAGFDSSLGTLESVTVSTAVSGHVSGEATNTSDAPFEFSILTVPGTVGTISGPGGAGSAITGFAVVFSETIPAHTTSVFDADFDAATNTTVVTDTTPYQAATVTFDAADAGAYAVVKPLNSAQPITTTFEMSASIEYCYATSGSIGITKTVTVDPGIDPGTFTFDVVCSDGYTTQVEIDGAGNAEISGMTAGSTCTVTEVFSAAQSGRWVVSVGGVCETESVVDLALGETAEFNNRLWAGAYDPCAASPI